MKKNTPKSLENPKKLSQRIVSSEHLVSKKSPELSELEFGMIIAWHAFERWMVRCISAAGVKDLTPTDVLIIHHVNHRQTQKKLSDICFTLNIEDTHVVSYGLKKLIASGLIENHRKGKEVFFSTTKKGKEICTKYREIREACLLPGFSGEVDDNFQLGQTAQLLRAVSGKYDQAARAATSL